jgi:hypothetical protein
MAKIIPGRFTAQYSGSFVVFLIGMRVNKFLAVRKWLTAARAMGPMLRTLRAHPEKGLLGAQVFFTWRGVATVQYWRSFEDLETFARDKMDPHLPAWRRFNQMVGTDGSVGIWHESYLVAAEQYECVYNNMPLFGLAEATAHVPALGQLETARRRLGGENAPAVPTPQQPLPPVRRPCPAHEHA